MQSQKRRHKFKIVIGIELFAIVVLLLLCIMKNNNLAISQLLKPNHQQMDVVLDAGHGGYDTGAIYKNIYEKDITLEITKEIGGYLKELGYRVLYTRESDEVEWPADEVADLDRRVAIANASEAKLFISIHMNAEEIAKGNSGYEIWGKTKDETVVALSNNILDQLDTLRYSINRGLKNQDLSPLKVLQDNRIPAILIEVGFIASERDLTYVSNPKTQEILGESIAKGIIQTLDSMTEKK